ncbi:MAG: ferritin family protein [Deltaproteobacteria bacterium]|nr:ferritin family protein [Deltaproteobacteria bacterium]
MAVFDADDIVEVAVRIEENGANFYRYAVQLAAREEVKILFQLLAAQEVKHRETFAKMLAGMERNAIPEGYDGEYAAYLHSYVDNHLIFTAEAFAAELAKLRDEASALDFAIQRELDSIHYYREMRELLPADRRDTIERIIDEEKEHFIRLSTMKKRLGC